MTDVLAMPNIVKTLAQSAPVTKAGKKISGKNYAELQSIHDNIGALLDTLADNKEEDTDMSKNDIQAMIEAAIAKAKEPTAPKEASPESLTKESIQQMIDEAIKKAVASGEEAASTDEIEKTIIHSNPQYKHLVKLIVICYSMCVTNFLTCRIRQLTLEVK